MSNIRPPKLIEFNDKCQSVREWAKELNISEAALYWRLRTHPITQAMSMKKVHHSGAIKYLQFQGKRQTMMEWAKELNISLPTLYWRLQRYSVRQALTCKKAHEGCGAKPKFITFNGKTQTRRQWCEELGLSSAGLYRRLRAYPEDMAKVMTVGHLFDSKPKREPKRVPKQVTFNGQTHTVSEWAKKLGVSRVTIYKRLEKLPIAEALSPKTRN